MTDNHAENISKHIKVYLMIGGALFVLTVVTVLAALLKFGVAAAVAVGLLIAVVKGSLVALFFMHLSNEKKVIYAGIGMTRYVRYKILSRTEEPRFFEVDRLATEEELNLRCSPNLIAVRSAR